MTSRPSRAAVRPATTRPGAVTDRRQGPPSATAAIAAAITATAPISTGAVCGARHQGTSPARKAAPGTAPPN
ncbi:hypothetical protein DZF91_08420, partial [Actinomadura logoneensis]